MHFLVELKISKTQSYLTLYLKNKGTHDRGIKLIRLKKMESQLRIFSRTSTEFLRH